MPKRVGKARVTVRLGNRRIPVPANRTARIVLGSSLVVIGIVGIPFPIIGLWMVPPGVLVLSRDSHKVRRFRRRSEIWALRRLRAYRARQTQRSTAAPLVQA